MVEELPQRQARTSPAHTLSLTSGLTQTGTIDLAGGALSKPTGFTNAGNAYLDARMIRQQMAAGTSPRATFDDLSSETKRAMLERLAGASSDLQLLAARAQRGRRALLPRRGQGAQARRGRRAPPP